jgi:hypothetical protein
MQGIAKVCGYVLDAASTHQLFLGRLAQRFRAATGQQMRVETQGAQGGHAVLRWLGLLLAHHANYRHQADVHYAKIAWKQKCSKCAASIFHNAASVAGLHMPAPCNGVKQDGASHLVRRGTETDAVPQ